MPVAAAAQPASGYKKALTVVTTLFFMWGFVTVLNDVLVPHLKSIFDLSYFRVMLIQSAFFSAYLIFSIPSAKLIDTIGYKKTMVAGLLTMSLGAFLFIPAASVPSYPLFLGALMVLAAGITALQVAANPYVAVLGSAETASSRLNLAQAFNSLGTTIGPYLGGLLILSAAPKSREVVRQMSAETLQAYRVHEAASVKIPYLVIGLTLFVLAIAIASFRLPPMPQAEHHEKGGGATLWKYRHLILGAVGIFVYVGAEVSIGSFLINYFSQSYIGNITEAQAAKFVSLYWGGAMVGRFIGSALLQGMKRLQWLILSLIALALLAFSFLASGGLMLDAHPRLSWLVSGICTLLISTRPILALCAIVFLISLAAALLRNAPVVVKTGTLLGIAAICAALLVTTSMASTGHLAMWSIILVGFFNSIMFPSIFTLGIAQLGPLTGDGSGLLVMSIIGGAIIPVVQGAIADRIGIHHAFVLPVICYLYIVFYALRGSVPRHTT